MANVLLLHIETSGELCSVCLTLNGAIIKEMNAIKERSHSKRLTLLIQEICIATGNKVSDISGIVLSKGPGSYTGLRVGSSVAKGLCYSLDIPIITMNTLTGLGSPYRDGSNNTLIVSAIIARKEEVYLQILDGNLKIVQETVPKQLTEDLLDPYLSQEINRIVFCGNATELAQAYLVHHNSIEYYQSEPSAIDLTHLSYELYQAESFDDLAYFDLDYIKSPNITTSKKKVLTSPIVKKKLTS